MTLLNIVTFPDKSLFVSSEKVEEIDETILKLIEDMAETMYEAPGVGLAAVQVGVHKNIIVYDETADKENKEYKVLINPVITESSGTYLSEAEGCLSVPEYTSNVKRYQSVVVEALNEKGEEIKIEAEDYFGVILQHEIDHLSGTLFIDKISKLKREMYKRKALKSIKQFEK